MREITLRVRHNKSRAVFAKVRKDDGGITLLHVTKLDGEVPKVEHLIGQVFPDIGTLRRVLVALMKDAVKHAAKRT